MVIVTAVFTAAVPAVKIATSDRVSLNEKLSERRHLLAALGLTDNPALNAEEADEIFRNQVVRLQLKGESNIVYGAVTEGTRVDTYAFSVGGRGFWGPIRGYLGVSPDGRTVKGISFTRHLETPGLGARIEEQWFTGQFRGKDISGSEDGVFIRFVPEGVPLEKNSVHAITGATRTSRALETFLNEDVKRIKKVLEGSKQ